MTPLEQALLQARSTPIPAEKLLAELKREAQKRREVYPNWVREGKLSAQTAAHRIVVMEQLALAVEQSIAKPDQLSLFGESGDSGPIEAGDTRGRQL